jgi:hypothetical protein
MIILAWQTKTRSQLEPRTRNTFYGQHAKGMVAGRTTYKSKMAGLEDDMFNVGAASDPAKFSKSLKNIENYIQKTYRSPDNIVKTLQHRKKATLSYQPSQRSRTHNAMMKMETLMRICSRWPCLHVKMTTSL